MVNGKKHYVPSFLPMVFPNSYSSRLLYYFSLMPLTDKWYRCILRAWVNWIDVTWRLWSRWTMAISLDWPSCYISINLSAKKRFQACTGHHSGWVSLQRKKKGTCKSIKYLQWWLMLVISVIRLKMSKRLAKYTIAFICEVIYRYSGLVRPIPNAVC